MKKLAIILILVQLSILTYAQEYDKYFTPDRLRVDLVFAGDAYRQNVYMDGLTKESNFSGSKTNLLDPFGYGEYYLEVKTPQGETIYSKGFNTLFQEWRTIDEAKTTAKSFNSSYIIPFPKDTVNLVISERVKESGEFAPMYTFQIDPNDKLINAEKSNNFNVVSILNNGDPAKKVDLLFIAEGYTAAEMDKFRKDAQKFSEYLFEMEPYKSRKSDFNVWAVESISNESGTDIPHQDIWKNTVANSNFFTFKIDRYLTAPDQKLISQIASNSPYDALYVIVNTEKYGGGGIYNFYGLSMADHKTEAPVFVHELGHSFAGLGDEYYESETAYNDFYNLKTEPWEPNVTTLVNFDSKWKDLIKEGTPVPTPNSKDYLDVVGLFEGGGYVSKGVYRPYFECRMKNNTAKDFCPACQRAINKMIDYYTE